MLPYGSNYSFYKALSKPLFIIWLGWKRVLVGVSWFVKVGNRVLKQEFFGIKIRKADFFCYITQEQ